MSMFRKIYKYIPPINIFNKLKNINVLNFVYKIRIIFTYFIAEQYKL